MILDALQLDAGELERRTGWTIKPEGACKGDRCVPLRWSRDAQIDVGALAERLQMPLIHDTGSDLWCLGPEAGGRALQSVLAPELVLPDVDGQEFSLSSLRGRKVLLVTWASW